MPSEQSPLETYDWLLEATSEHREGRHFADVNICSPKLLCLQQRVLCFMTGVPEQFPWEFFVQCLCGSARFRNEKALYPLPTNLSETEHLIHTAHGPCSYFHRLSFESHYFLHCNKAMVVLSKPHSYMNSNPASFKLPQPVCEYRFYQGCFFHKFHSVFG